MKFNGRDDVHATPRTLSGRNPNATLTEGGVVWVATRGGHHKGTTVA